MMNLVVGDSDCSFYDIVLSLRNLPCVGELAGDWKRLSMGLGTPPIKVKVIQQDLIFERKGILDVVQDLLEDWRSRLASEAKLSKLLDILEHDCDWKDMADHLWEKYKTRISEHTTWADLDERTKAKILATKMSFLGAELPLAEILNRIEENQRTEILVNSLTGPLILKLLNNSSPPFLLASETRIPEIPPYYIPRTLSSRRRVDSEIFQKKNYPDIFIIDNIELHELSRITGNERVDRSSQQMDKLTVRFMVMEFQEDFDMICEKAGSCPVHHLRYNDGMFHWIRSHGSLKLIQSFLHKFQKLIPQSDFLRVAQGGPEKLPICIADSPGMGKSLLLAKLSQQRKEENPSSILLFLNFSEFLEHLNLKPEDETQSKAHILRWISDYRSGNELGRQILHHFTTESQQDVEMFLDGFDEVPPKKLEQATKLLKCLTTKPTNIRVYVATRLHRREHLEETLGALSFNISPLGEDDQVHLLKQLWSHKFCISANENLEQFAKELISSVRSTVSSKECDIAGIPLQCAMLSEIYAEDAKKYGNAISLKFGVSVRARSLHEMYRMLMEERLQKAEPQMRNYIRSCHQIAAASLLFPEFVSEFEAHLGIKMSEITELERINRVGILLVQEISGSTKEQLTFTFLHRTYAEFLMAGMLVESLQQLGNGREDKLFGYQLVCFFFHVILKLTTADGGVLVGSGECENLDVWEKLCKTSQVDLCRYRWTRIALGLNMSVEDISFVSGRVAFFEDMDDEEYTRDPLYWLLYQWTDGRKTARSLDHLVETLCSLNLKEAAATLKRTWYRKTFQHETLCFFIDACLAATDVSESISRINHLPSLISSVDSTISSKIYNQLQVCILQNFVSLFNLLSQVCLSMKNAAVFSELNIGKWSDLVVDATKWSRLSMLEDCCRFIEALQGESLAEIKFTKTHIVSWEWTPLHEACVRGDYSIFAYLHQRFGNRVPKMKGLLHWCTDGSWMNSSQVISEKVQIIMALLKANPTFLNEQEPERKRTPILMWNVHFELLKFLIEKGANPLVVDREYEETAVHRAARYSSSGDFHRLTILLLEKGHGDVFFLRNNKHFTPLDYALELQDINLETIGVIASHLTSSENSRDSAFDWDQALYSAVVGGKDRIILEELIKCGANPHKKYVSKRKFVHVAAYSGNVDAIQYFASLGCKVNGRDTRQRTPLHLSLIQGQKNVDQVVRALLEVKADLNAVDDEGHTPLWYAENPVSLRQLQPDTLELLRLVPNSPKPRKPRPKPRKSKLACNIS